MAKGLGFIFFRHAGIVGCMAKVRKPTPTNPLLIEDAVLIRTACMPLVVSKDQGKVLAELQDEFDKACNRASGLAQVNRCWSKRDLHSLAYYPIRAKSPLKSQHVNNAIKKAAAAYRTLRSNGEIPAKGKGPVPLARFKRGTVHFDARTFSLETSRCPVSGKAEGRVSLTVMPHQIPESKEDQAALGCARGRIRLDVVIGSRQAAMLATGRWREADLVYKANAKAGPRWELHLALEYDRPGLANPKGGWLGVDLGDNVLIATSEGLLVEGGRLHHARSCFKSHRNRLEAHGSQSAKQSLRQVSGKESRYVFNVCRMLALEVVNQALDLGYKGLVLEDLTGIHQKHTRKAKRNGKDMRRRLRNWPYRRLREAIIQAALTHGLEVLLIHPAYTSTTCSQCQQPGSRNKHVFSCSCGHRAHSDINASCNLTAVALAWEASARVSVNAPPKPKTASRYRPAQHTGSTGTTSPVL